jgi:hypothetical protein
MGGGGGGCRWEARAAAGLRRGGVLGKRKNGANVVTGMQEGVHSELKDTLQVEEEAR